MPQARWIVPALALIVPMSAAASRCDDVLSRIGAQLADASCVESPDLTTNNPSTTPGDNSIPGLPPFAFTPTTDRGVIAPSAAFRPPITHAVPGVQIDARIASDPTGEARFLLRLPNDWNGRLVVAGASGTRSEFNGDFAWSDYVLQKGYARTRRRTRACSTCSSPPRRIRSDAASIRRFRSTCISTTTTTGNPSAAGPSTW